MFSPFNLCKTSLQPLSRLQNSVSHFVIQKSYSSMLRILYDSKLETKCPSFEKFCKEATELIPGISIAPSSSRFYKYFSAFVGYESMLALAKLEPRYFLEGTNITNVINIGSGLLDDSSDPTFFIRILSENYDIINNYLRKGDLRNFHDFFTKMGFSSKCISRIMGRAFALVIEPQYIISNRLNHLKKLGITHPRYCIVQSPYLLLMDEKEIDQNIKFYKERYHIESNNLFLDYASLLMEPLEKQIKVHDFLAQIFEGNNTKLLNALYKHRWIISKDVEQLQSLVNYIFSLGFPKDCYNNPNSPMWNIKEKWIIDRRLRILRFVENDLNVSELLKKYPLCMSTSVENNLINCIAELLITGQFENCNDRDKLLLLEQKIVAIKEIGSKAISNIRFLKLFINAKMYSHNDLFRDRRLWLNLSSESLPTRSAKYSKEFFKSLKS